MDTPSRISIKTQWPDKRRCVDKKLDILRAYIAAQRASGQYYDDLIEPKIYKLQDYRPK